MYIMKTWIVTLLGLGSLMFCEAQEASDLMRLVAQYQEVPTDITYLEVDGVTLKLDVYRAGDHLGEPPWVDFGESRKPTLVYIHGGGWSALDKSIVIFKFLPFLEKGWTVVNVNYRLGMPMIPAMVDCRCALNWVYENAEEYGFDTDKIVLSGASAGGHLSLITGMKNADYFESPCEIDRSLNVAAIVNWFGVTDLTPYKDWIEQNSKTELGEIPIHRWGSPIEYVHPDIPPILTIHGTNDTTVPYSQATILHERLESAGMPNVLHTIPDGKHGGFSAVELEQSFEQIWKFLKEHLD